MASFGEDQEEEEAALVSASITDEQLAVLAGTNDIAGVSFLQMTVDSVQSPITASPSRAFQLT